MKKLIVLILPVLLLTGCYKKTSAPPTIPIIKDDRVSYNNTQYGFSFKFSKDFEFIESQKNRDAITASSYIPACDPETSVACLIYDKQKYYPNTNFDSAGFSVNRITTAKDATTCASLKDRGYTNRVMTKQTINATEFDTATLGDAATGHYLSEKVFRTFSNDTCFEIGLRVSQSNFDNYDPSLGVKEFTKADEAAVWQKLDSVLATFQFLE